MASVQARSRANSASHQAPAAFVQSFSASLRFSGFPEFASVVYFWLRSVKTDDVEATSGTSFQRGKRGALMMTTSEGRTGAHPAGWPCRATRPPG